MLFHANGSPKIGIAFEPDNGTGAGGNNGGDGKGGGEGDPPGDDDDDAGDDLEKLKAVVAKERKRAKELERELKPLKTAAQQKADADKSEAQKATERAEAAERQRDELSATVRTTRVERAVRAADRTLSLGLHDSDLVADLLKLPDDAFDADGQPVAKKVETAVKALIQSRPYLAGQVSRRPGNGDGGAGGGGDEGTDMNSLLRRQRGR